MKKSLLSAALICTVLLSGCGSKSEMATKEYQRNDTAAGDYFKSADKARASFTPGTIHSVWRKLFRNSSVEKG